MSKQPALFILNSFSLLTPILIKRNRCMNRLNKTDDVRIDAVTELLPPIAHLYELPISDEAEKLVVQTRQEIADLVHGKDNRLLVIVGPCSIHDPAAAVEYAQRLLPLRRQYEKELLVVMRV